MPPVSAVRFSPALSHRQISVLAVSSSAGAMAAQARLLYCFLDLHYEGCHAPDGDRPIGRCVRGINVARAGGGRSNSADDQRPGDDLCRRHRGRRHRSVRAAAWPASRPTPSRPSSRDGGRHAGRRRHPRRQFPRPAGAARRHRHDHVRGRPDPGAADRSAQSWLRHGPIHLDRRAHQGRGALFVVGTIAVQDDQ